ncbi:MAG TPA: hypothetical protein PLU16_07720 [Gallionellaceae bacterium]|jgi:hypothetical protein|nr:hypothetical protein [Gallionellaceae bacterium]HQS75082.1 hypothetical protein [Gallionellaceae bacterium]
MHNTTNNYRQLTKSQILLHRQCPKRLWLSVHHPEIAEADDSGQARRTKGVEVGKVARGLYPDGILIESLDQQQALMKTQACLDKRKNPILRRRFKLMEC